MSYEAVAKRYAQAIFELGVESSSVSTLTEDIRRFTQTYSSSAELRAVATNPLVDAQARAATLEEIANRLGLSRIAQNAILLLSERRRLAALPAIAKELGRLSDERSGMVRATVTSAQTLPDEYCQRLQRELSQITGSKILLERRIDPGLIAGVVVRLGDRVIDGSAKTRLSQLRSQLLSV